MASSTHNLHNYKINESNKHLNAKQLQGMHYYFFSLNMIKKNLGMIKLVVHGSNAHPHEWKEKLMHIFYTSKNTNQWKHIKNYKIDWIGFLAFISL